MQFWDAYYPEKIQETKARRKAGLEEAGIGELPRLIVLCGPSHAGKTTLARRLCKGFTVISSDEIRKRLRGGFEGSRHETKVWNVFESMKCEALRKKHNVVLDACHMSRRARWHSLQGPNAHHVKICVVFDAPFGTVRERCLKQKRVPLKEVEQMWLGFQNSKPTEHELRLQGFDEVYFVKGVRFMRKKFPWCTCKKRHGYHFDENRDKICSKCGKVIVDCCACKKWHGCYVDVNSRSRCAKCGKEF